MTRLRSTATPTATAAAAPTSTAQSNTSRIRAAGLRVTNPSASQSVQARLPNSDLPSIRLVPYHDPNSPRPSLAFPTLTRTLPSLSSTIRVGRYSEKDAATAEALNNTVSDAPVGFKSKVVSRKHCEFFYLDNQWHIKDVKSSSGTFLNHIRLSPPGEESKPFAIKDGDLVQLGIDFKGGEEMIFRCVKIRILCNRGWQKSLNKFNKSAHKQLNDLQRSTSEKGSDKQFKDSTECTICLNSIAPCQSLFVAPCSHTWHYKCIRPMLEEANRTTIAGFTQFLCPNCRAVTDLNADIDEVPIWQDDFSDHENVMQQPSHHGPDMPADIHEPTTTVSTETPDYPLYSDVESLTIQDRFQEHPSFGLPPASTSISRTGSPRALNPGASAFIPNAPHAPNASTRSTSSTSNRSGSPARPLGGSNTSGRNSAPPSPEHPAVSFALSMPPGHVSTPSTNEMHNDILASVTRTSQNGQTRSVSNPVQRFTRNHSTLESPEEFTPSPADDDEDGISPLDPTRTISPTTSSAYSTMLRTDTEILRQNSGDSDGPLTPRNHAGPFIFDGGSAQGRASSDETHQSLNLNSAASL